MNNTNKDNTCSISIAYVFLAEVCVNREEPSKALPQRGCHTCVCLTCRCVNEQQLHSRTMQYDVTIRRGAILQTVSMHSSCIVTRYSAM